MEKMKAHCWNHIYVYIGFMPFFIFLTKYPCFMSIIRKPYILFLHFIMVLCMYVLCIIGKFIIKKDF